MSIAKRQLRTIIDKIIKEELQKGVVPTVKKISARINNFFKDRVLGQPIMKYRPAKYRGKSSSEDWNKTIEEIHTDLNILYEETLDQTERVLKDFDYIETEKRKIERKLDSLENRAKELLLLSSNTEGYVSSVFDSFKDLSKVDLNKTNCWIDLSLNQVTPMVSRIGNIKEDLSLVTPVVSLETKSDIISERTIEGIANMLDDNINTSWITEVVSKKEQEIEYKIFLDVDIKAATRITIHPQVSSEAVISLSISEDMFSWKPIGTKISDKVISWDFAETSIKAVQISILKKYADTTVPLDNGKLGYVYYVGIKNISILKIGFEDAGSLYSVPLDIKDKRNQPMTVNMISLEVNEEVSSSSKIKYFIGFIDKSQDIEWVPISHIMEVNALSPKIIDLKNVNLEDPIKNILHGNAKLYKTANGLDFYSIISEQAIPLSRNVIKDSSTGTPQLYKGVNQWRVESYKFKKPAGDYPKISDWTNLPSIDSASIKTSYCSVSTELPANGGSYMNYRYSTNIYASKESTINNLALSTSEGKNLMATIYVNQIEIFNGEVFESSNQQITISLAKGWNSIQVLIYDKEEVPSEKSLFLSKNINSSEIVVRAQIEPMDLVSEFDLLYNILEKDTNKFCITPNNKVIVSKFLIEQEPIFEFRYKYSLREDPTKIIFRADMSKDEGTSVPPKLKYYKLRIFQ